MHVYVMLDECSSKDILVGERTNTHVLELSTERPSKLKKAIQPK